MIASQCGRSPYGLGRRCVTNRRTSVSVASVIMSGMLSGAGGVLANGDGLLKLYLPRRCAIWF